MGAKQQRDTGTYNQTTLPTDQHGYQAGQGEASRRRKRVGRWRWRRRLFALVFAMLIAGAVVFWFGTGRIVSGALYVVQRQLAADSILLTWKRVLWLPPYTLIIGGVHVHRHPDLDVFVNRAAIRIRWQSIWKGVFRIQSLTVQDVQGTVRLPAANSPGDTETELPTSSSDTTTGSVGYLPAFRLDRLTIQDVFLTLIQEQDTLTHIAGLRLGVHHVQTRDTILTLDSLVVYARHLQVGILPDTTETPPSDTLWLWSWLAVLPPDLQIGVAHIRTEVDTFTLTFTQIDSFTHNDSAESSQPVRTTFAAYRARGLLNGIELSRDSLVITRMDFRLGEPSVAVSGAIAVDVAGRVLAVPQVIMHTPAWTLHYAGWVHTASSVVRTADPIANIEGWHTLSVATCAGDTLWRWLTQWTTLLGQNPDILPRALSNLPASRFRLAMHTWAGRLAAAWQFTLVSSSGSPLLHHQNLVITEWGEDFSLDSFVHTVPLPITGSIQGTVFMAPALQEYWREWLIGELDSSWQVWWSALTPVSWTWEGTVRNQTLALRQDIWLGAAHLQAHIRYEHGAQPGLTVRWTGTALALPSPVETRVDSVAGWLTMAFNEEYTLRESKAEVVAHHVVNPYLRDSVNFRLTGELHSSIWHLSLWLYGREVVQQLIFTMHGTQKAFFTRGQGQGSITCRAAMPHGWNALPFPVHLHPLETHFRFQWREDALLLTWDLAESQVRLDTVWQSLAGTMGGLRWTAPDSLNLWVAGPGIDGSFQAVHLTALTSFLEANPLWGFFPDQALPPGQIALHLTLDNVPEVLLTELMPEVSVETPVKIQLSVIDSAVRISARVHHLCYLPGEICASNLMMESQITPGQTRWQAVIRQITLPTIDTLLNWHVLWQGDSLLGTFHLKTHFAQSTHPFVLQFAFYRSGWVWRMGIDSMVFPYGGEQWYAVPAYCIAGPGSVCIPDLFITNTERTASLGFSLQPEGYYALHVERFGLTPLLRTFVVPYVGMDLAGRVSCHIRMDTLFRWINVDSFVLREVRLDTFRMPIWRLAGSYDLKEQVGTIRLTQHSVFQRADEGMLAVWLTPHRVRVALDSFEVGWVQPFLTGILDSFGGSLSTEQPIEIVLGSGETPRTLNGTIQVHGLHFHVAFTGVTYTATGKAILDGDSLQLRLVVSDPAGRLGRATGAVHFQPFSYSVAIATRDLLAMATTAEQNPDYYGTARIGGTVRLYGDLSTFWIALEGVTPIRPSELTMPIYTGPYVSEEDWIRFRPRQPTGVSRPSSRTFSPEQQQHAVHASTANVKSSEEESSASSESEEFAVGFRATIHLSDALTLVVPFDPPTGDILEVAGTGNMEMEYLPDGRFAMRGIYQIQAGSYRFNYSGLIVKEFQIVEGTIRWTGSPYDGLLDLVAEYRQKTTTTNLTLYQQQQQQQGGGQASTLPRYVTAIVRMHMQGTLAQPTLAFELDIAEAERDPRLAAIVRAINANPQERDYQVFSLLAINQFAPPRYAGGGVVAGASNVYQTMSHFMSQQLTSLAQELLGDESLQLTVGYQKGKEATGQKAVAVEVGISKALFGQRMVIDIGGTMVRAHEGSQLSGTMQLEYLLTKDGRWRWRLFSQMQEGAAGQKVYYTGMGLRYVRHFERLFRKKQQDNQQKQNGKAMSDMPKSKPSEEEKEDSP